MKRQEKRELIYNELSALEEHYPLFRELYFNLAQIALKYIDVMSNKLSANKRELVYEEMDIENSIELVKEFLRKLNVKYLEEFNSALSDGTIDLFLPKDINDERLEDPALKQGDNKDIVNLPIHNKINDGMVIVHEFFHYLSKEKNETLNFNNWMFDEMLSIYFEMRYAMFLCEKGYDKTYFYKTIYSRLYDTYSAANETYLNGAMADVFSKTKSVNYKSIMCLNRNRKIYKEHIEKIIRNSNNKDTFYEFCLDFVENSGYLSGTLLSINALRDVKQNDSNMIYICDNINNLEPEEILNKLNVEIKDYQLAIFVCAKILNEAKRELDEESYSDSRSDRSR